MNAVTSVALSAALLMGLSGVGATTLAAPAGVGAASAAPTREAAPTPEGTAAPALTWSVRPADATGPDDRKWIEEAADAGETLREYLAVTNFSKEDVTFGLAAADGYFTNDGHFTLKRPDEEMTGAGTWITFDHDSVDVAAGATQVVGFAVTVPENATPGDYAAGVAAGILISGIDESGSNVGVNSRVGFRVMVQVKGEIAPALDIKNLSASYDLSWNPFTPGAVRTQAEITNSGNALVNGSATAQVHGVEADTVTQDLLPGESFTIDRSLPGVWPFGPMTVEITAVGRPNEGSAEPVTVTQSVLVWAIPTPQIIVILALTLITFGIVALRRRDRRKWEAKLEAARAAGRAEATGEDAE